MPFFKQFKPDLLIDIADGQSLDLSCWRSCRSVSSVSLVVVFMSNAVNLTDGLDGLAIGLMVIAAGALTVLTYASGHARIRRVPGTRAQSAHAAS